MKNTGKDYERLTQIVFEQIVNQTKTKNIEVKHDVILEGKTTSHQIDVYWKFEVGGIEYSAVVQAKDWKSKVPQEKMLAFKAILDDLPSGTKGIFVTTTGYQRGAIEVAQKNGICIYELRPPKESDWDGCVRVVDIESNIAIPQYRNLVLKIDSKWAVDNNIELEKIASKFSANGNKAIYNEELVQIDTLGRFIEKLQMKSPNQMKYMIHTFQTGTFLEIDGVYLKVESISGEFGHVIITDNIHIDAMDFVGAILKDVIGGTTKTFDKNNVLKGNNQENDVQGG